LIDDEEKIKDLKEKDKREIFEFSNLGINFFTALGTVAVAILAVWSKQIINKLNPGKAKIIPIDNLHGYPDPNGNWWFHMALVKTSGGESLTDARVFLSKVYKKTKDGFAMQSYPFKRQLAWTPKEFSPTTQTIKHDREFDVGCFFPVQKHFYPSLYQPDRAEGAVVKSGETFRYLFACEAEGLKDRCVITIEISLKEASVWEAANPRNNITIGVIDEKTSLTNSQT
jgi:hypothetical protein